MIIIVVKSLRKAKIQSASALFIFKVNGQTHRLSHIQPINDKVFQYNQFISTENILKQISTFKN